MSRLALIALFPVLLAAQDASFVAELASPTVAAGQQFQLSFVFTGSGSGRPSDFAPPDFGQFVVISGPNTSQSFQFVNGSASVSVTYGYVLYARAEGAYTIGPASVTHDGKKLTTAPAKVTVTKGAPAAQQQQQGAAGGQTVQVGDNILLRAVADRDRVRLGEQVTVSWKIYLRASLSNYRVAKLPTFEGFWAEDFELPQQPALTDEVFNGKQYKVATLKKTALFASQTGRLTVSPMELVCAVQVQTQRRGQDPFDRFFNDPFFQRFQTAEVNVASDPVTIRVDGFPDGAPEGFTNAVGSYTFKASVDKKDVNAGEAITLRVTVEGTGNIKLVTLPKPSVPTDIETFDPTLSEDIRREGEVVRGSKTAEYVLVPRNAGQRRIEPLVFSYYDPGRRAYRTLRSDAFALAIEPGKELAMGSAGLSREDVQLLGDDIRFLKLEPGDLRPVGDTGGFGPGFLLLFFAPPFVFIGSFIYRKRMEKVYGDLPTLRFERAGKEASKRLKKARTLQSQGNAEEYNAEILRAVSGYLEHKLRIPKASLGLDEIVRTLGEHAVSADTLANVRTCIERAEYSRYAPGGDSAETRKDLLDLADSIIRGIDKEYRA